MCACKSEYVRCSMLPPAVLRGSALNLEAHLSHPELGRPREAKVDCGGTAINPMALAPLLVMRLLRRYEGRRKYFTRNDVVSLTMKCLRG
jgi:hypothetical protein